MGRSTAGSCVRGRCTLMREEISHRPSAVGAARAPCTSETASPPTAPSSRTMRCCVRSSCARRNRERAAFIVAARVEAEWWRRASRSFRMVPLWPVLSLDVVR